MRINASLLLHRAGQCVFSPEPVQAKLVLLRIGSRI